MQQQRITPQWRPQTPIPGGAVANLINPLNKAAGPTMTSSPTGSQPIGQSVEPQQRPIQLFQANLQPPPPVPPENIASEQDRQTQINYENWLNQQNTQLSSQLKYYETEIGKLRKVKKQLNTKQRQMKKNNRELEEGDMKELTQVTSDHAILQKQLDNSRKLQRQHTLLITEYKTKQQAKLQGTLTAGPGSSPAQIAPPSPLMSPSPGSQQNLLHQAPAQSPLNNPILQPNQSPLHSPGPLMSQSPGPASVNSVMQSPGNHTNSNSAMSPYNTMQPSPRIGTPHSQPTDDNPFSPGPSPSPSIPGRLTSPAPRMTSPQH